MAKKVDRIGEQVELLIREALGDARKIPENIAAYAAKQAEGLLQVPLSSPAWPGASKAAAQAVALYAGIQAVDAADSADRLAYQTVLAALRVGAALLA